MSNAKKILVGSLWIAAACSVLGFVTLSREQARREDALPALFPAPSFSLVDADENSFDSSALQGQVYIVRFFFSECPGVCPMMSKRLLELQNAIPDPRVKFVSFTVDPERDNPQVMRAYRDDSGLDRSRNIFLTGSLEEMKTLPTKFHFPPINQPAEHTKHLILIDRNAQVRGLYLTDFEDDMKQLPIDVQKLLEEQP